MFYKQLLTIVKVSIIVFTFFESYLFPFAIFKWMIVVTRYGGLITLIRDCKPKETIHSFNYRLQLKTTSKDVANDGEVVQESYVNLMIENDRVQLSYCGQDCSKIPPALQKMYGAKVKHLDLSYNSIETLKGLEQFARLEELIMDNNKLGDGVEFPYLLYLRTLSLNNNQITDLEKLVNRICERYPQLSYLSLLSNKACPNQLSDLDKDDSDYQRYRYFVIHKIPNLRFLDSRRVSSSERKEAVTRGQFMRVRRPPAAALAAPAPATSLPVKGNERPLPVDFAALGKHKGAYGKCHYKYTGKHSEGNRFIRNSDL